MQLIAQKVIESKKHIKTATQIEYGGQYRVKYIKTDKDKHETHVLAQHEETYTEQAKAETAYAEIVAAMQ